MNKTASSSLARTGVLAALAWAVITPHALAHDSLGLTAPKPNLAATPPMGWNSWNKFACNVDEAKVRAVADSMAANGMKDAGYKYVIIDDCWQTERASDGTIQADVKKFPAGIKALADYVHSKGLKFGLYSDAGALTCGGRPGSAGHEFQDARTYAAWGVDYLKYDWCNTGTRNAEAAYTIMAKALRASGRDILLSICEWGDNKPREWAPKVGHMWRTTGDIRDSWSQDQGNNHSFLWILDKQEELWKDSGPNQWNDPDMLEVGNGGMTTTEYRAHFSMWAMLAAPLIAGNDLSTMTEDTRSILINRDVIAVDQDSLGQQARKVSDEGDFEIWERALKGGEKAVVLLNRSEGSKSMSVNWETLGWPAGLKATTTDLWSKQVIKAVTGKYTADVPAHGATMIRITPTL
ncbi:glycoside hydrolase family 27 protein [Asticcacaulis benevestitus]|uniref:Alpha-galactosidase n=1 Tax=Asticcacaulis benevestitus DSM 16100 = ATCC BAA-896 TaxID=1121022 RepID=V4NXH4_9CAUL|nr:glycoside hydrolase family 27 protein [Asticcacaulis benevestitus]ESQ86497.1 alpha-galactosidase [Asticcacaulis benevestitus DSM 16100 = ATCC BAA-896]